MADEKSPQQRQEEAKAQRREEEQASERRRLDQQAGRQQAVESSGRYRLMAPHIIANAPIEAGTEVGTDTDYPWPDAPTNQMMGVDDAGVAKVRDLHQQLYGKEPPWLDPKAEEERRREGERALEEERNAEPVSAQQAWERGHDEYRSDKLRGQNLRGPLAGSTPSLTRSGDTSQGRGPATPVQEPERPTRPLEEQLPKS